MRYDDILNLPHPVSKKHPRMSTEERAAQFSPFSALTGYDESIDESDRQVERFSEFDENYLEELDKKLQFIREHIGEHPPVEVTLFIPDGKKEGGSYETVCGRVEKIDEVAREIRLDGRRIRLNTVSDISIKR